MVRLGARKDLGRKIELTAKQAKTTQGGSMTEDITDSVNAITNIKPPLELHTGWKCWKGIYNSGIHPNNYLFIKIDEEPDKMYFYMTDEAGIFYLYEVGDEDAELVRRILERKGYIVRGAPLSEEDIKLVKELYPEIK